MRYVVKRFFDAEEICYRKHEKEIFEYLKKDLAQDLASLIIEKGKAKITTLPIREREKTLQYDCTVVMCIDLPDVKCKECKFYSKGLSRCIRFNEFFKPDGFCSKGERKEDQDAAE